MKVNKLALSFSNLAKLQPSYNLKKIFPGGMLLQNFSHGPGIIESKIKNSVTELSIKGLEGIAKLRPITKKGNKLSTVEEKDLEIVESLKKGNIYYPYKNPTDRAKKLLLQEAKLGTKKAVKFFTKVDLGTLEPQYFIKETDILIIGGGPVGLSIAYTFRNKFPYGPSVTVVDKNGSFPHLSTNLGQGIVSLQLFNDDEEISILKYGIEFLSSFHRNTEIDGKPQFKLPYDPLGTLILADSNNAEEIIKKNERMKMLGISNKILSAKTLKAKFPWLNVNNILFGSLGMSNEGMVDPWSYLFGLKCKAINLGVNFVTAEVIDFGFKLDPVNVICRLPDGSYNSINFSYCIIAGGIESLNLVNVLNESNHCQFRLRLPMEERLRYEYCLYNPDGPGLNTPTIIDSDGTYFRRDGLLGHYITGFPSVIHNENEESEPYHIFNNKIKPFLMRRMPDLNKLEFIRGWIDAYDFCISNQVGITGPHPDSHSIIFALGFSNLGLQYVPALSRAIMEYIAYDSYQTIDFTPFHIENLWRKQHLEADRKRALLESHAFESHALPDSEDKQERHGSTK